MKAEHRSLDALEEAVRRSANDAEELDLQMLRYILNLAMMEIENVRGRLGRQNKSAGHKRGAA